MECECGGALLEGRSSYRVSRNDFTFILDNIPAYKCTRCDRVLFTDTTAEQIQKLANRIERDTGAITTGQTSVNLYDY